MDIKHKSSYEEFTDEFLAIATGRKISLIKLLRDASLVATGTTMSLAEAKKLAEGLLEAAQYGRKIEDAILLYRQSVNGYGEVSDLLHAYDRLNGREKEIFRQRVGL